MTGKWLKNSALQQMIVITNTDCQNHPWTTANIFLDGKQLNQTMTQIKQHETKEWQNRNTKDTYQWWNGLPAALHEPDWMKFNIFEGNEVRILFLHFQQRYKNAKTNGIMLKIKVSTPIDIQLLVSVVLLLVVGPPNLFTSFLTEPARRIWPGEQLWITSIMLF